MSDFFGIGPAIKSCVDVYFQTARRTGRTTRLINSLEDGDRVVFLSYDHARHANRVAREQGKELDFIVVDPKNPECAFERGRSQGRTIFDHSWIEAVYKHRLEDTEKYIKGLEFRLSAGKPTVSPPRRF